MYGSTRFVFTCVCVCVCVCLFIEFMSYLAGLVYSRSYDDDIYTHMSAYISHNLLVWCIEETMMMWGKIHA
jgi:hypothetical protein